MKFSRILLSPLFVAFIVLAIVSQPTFATETECKEGECEGYEDPKCPSRPHIVRCAAAYLDINKNNQLEKEELETAIAALPWYARGILKIIGSVPKIMEKCDADRDGAISIKHDMDATQETCLASCFKKKSFKAAFFPECDL